MQKHQEHPLETKHQHLTTVVPVEDTAVVDIMVVVVPPTAVVVVEEEEQHPTL